MPFRVIRLHLIECFFRLHTANTPFAILKQLKQLYFQSLMSLSVFFIKSVIH